MLKTRKECVKAGRVRARIASRVPRSRPDRKGIHLNAFGAPNVTAAWRGQRQRDLRRSVASIYELRSHKLSSLYRKVVTD